MIVVGAKSFNLLRYTVLDDTSLGVLKATHRSVMLARPSSNEAPRSLIVLGNSPRWLPSAVELVGRLGLGGTVKVYLASFVTPIEPAAGMFFSYREYRRLRSETLVSSDDELLRSSLTQSAASLTQLGYETEVVVSEGNPDQNLKRLVEDVSCSAVIIGASAFAAGFLSSTADALNAALRVPCSVMVAR